MKKLAWCLFTGFFVSCSGGGTKTTTTEQHSPNVPIENVNGNVPDTINSVSLDKTVTDSTTKDSTRK